MIGSKRGSDAKLVPWHEVPEVVAARAKVKAAELERESANAEYGTAAGPRGTTPPVTMQRMLAQLRFDTADDALTTARLEYAEISQRVKEEIFAVAIERRVALLQRLYGELEVARATKFELDEADATITALTGFQFDVVWPEFSRATSQAESAYETRRAGHLRDPRERRALPPTAIVPVSV